MLVEKQKVLENAVNVLNKEEQPWEVSIEGDSIIAKWKWMDASFFGPSEVTDETKEFFFKVTLKDNGKWNETDYKEENKTNVDLKNGKVSFGTSSFQGTSVGKSFQIGLGQNKQTGETGIIKFKFDTSIIKEPIRQYLKDCGWKKAGLFF